MITVNIDDITLNLIEYTNYYLQWKHIAVWQFRFNIYLWTREAMEQLNETIH